MDDEKVTLWAVSVSATRTEVGIQSDRSVYEQIRNSHFATMATGKTVDEASQSIKRQAFDKFPKGEGWTNHHAMGMAVTEVFLNGAIEEYTAGNLNTDSEDAQPFYIDL